ncbi:Acetylcholine receptor subunit alpha-like 2 [Lamellibrachia satsuma]|nr:Acetylcholine receptor subunit alpha-like 2 [Lamellibrachia satsuma]
MTCVNAVAQDWNDTRLTWSPQDYDNVTDIVLKPHRIWLPELALMNGAIELSPDFRKIRVLVRYDGRVHWEPGGVFMTTCDIDIRYFPFDKQGCVIQFGAWAYYSDRMNVTNASANIQTHGTAQERRVGRRADEVGVEGERPALLPPHALPLCRVHPLSTQVFI